MCKPYFQLKSALSPHLEPYYESYAAPYVNAARPYYNTLDNKVITPVTALSMKYGAPRVAQAQAFGTAQWEKNLQPQVRKYQKVAQLKYDQTLAPHINKASSAVTPYVDIAKTNALQTYYGHVLPTYVAVQPYALQGYGLASGFLVGTVVPYSQWAWSTGGIFLDRTVFPKLRILYGENVEPQLVRIGERLGRYRDGKKLMAAVNDIDRYVFPATESILKLLTIPLVRRLLWLPLPASLLSPLRYHLYMPPLPRLAQRQVLLTRVHQLQQSQSQPR